MAAVDAPFQAAAVTSPFTHHGGALDAARRLYPAAPQPWVDLSTGINPVPYPVGEIALDAFATLNKIR